MIINDISVKNVINIVCQDIIYILVYPQRSDIISQMNFDTVLNRTSHFQTNHINLNLPVFVEIILNYTLIDLMIQYFSTGNTDW